MKEIKRAKVVDRETFQVYLRITEKPWNDYFWLRAKALAVEKVSKDRNIDKERLEVVEE